MERMNHEGYMKLALDMAQKTLGQTGINPVVGCVIVKEGRVVGLGAHLRRGSAHAEVHALQMAGKEAEGSTAYVTLEPCSHYGKTPPCADQLIAAKVKKVVVAAEDPNPRVAGRGIAKLREHGIEVETGVLRSEAEKLNEVFNKYITSGVPFVTIKTASTLDGKIAAKTGDSQWITGAESRQYVHVLRHRHDAIMVGIGTALHDDPSLTVRLPVEGVHPVRLIVDSKLRLPHTARVVTDRSAPTWVIATERASKDKERELNNLGIEVIRCGADQVDLPLAMKKLGERDISSVLVEGGGRLNGSLLTAKLVDKVVLFFAPKLIGGAGSPGNFQFDGFDEMKEAIRLSGVEYKTFDDDLCIIGYPDYGKCERGDNSASNHE